MSVPKRHVHFLIAVWLVLALVFSACTPAAAPEPAAPAAEAPGDEEAAAQPEAAPQVSAAEMERRETLIFDIDGGRVVDPELWNPYVPGSRRDQGYHQAILEPLFILNYETGEIEPWLGESMTSNETLDVWTLILRDGIRWSDGEVFDADDVVFTINLLLDNTPELNYSASLDTWIESVEKIDDLTVQFNLKRPNPRFQLDNWSVKLWGGPIILPEHIWNGQDPLTFKFYDPEQGWPVGTGPYTLSSIGPTEFIYVRDDNWWGAETGWKPLPRPKQLVWVWAGPEETRAALMADAQLDSLMDITLGAFLALQQRNPNVVAWHSDLPYAIPDPCERNLELNLTMEPWNDKEMRWALNHAIDREEVARIAYEGTTIPAKSIFPAYPPLNRLIDLAEEAGLYEQYPLTEHNPDKTRAILESKGYALNSNGYYEKDGQELTLDITTHEAFIELQRNAQVMVEQFQAVGINASTRNEAGGTWGDNAAFGNFEAKSGWQTCGSVNEPWGSLDVLNTRWLVPLGERASGNQWRWSGEGAEAFSAIVDEMGTLPLGDPRVDALFLEAWEIFLDELPVIPVAQAKKLIPLDTTYWTNWPTAENNYISSWTWWQSTHKIIHAVEPAQ